MSDGKYVDYRIPKPRDFAERVRWEASRLRHGVQYAESKVSPWFILGMHYVADIWERDQRLQEKEEDND